MTLNIKDKKVSWSFFENEETPMGIKIATTKKHTLYFDNNQYRIFNEKRNSEIVGHGCKSLGDCIVYIEMFENINGYYNNMVKELAKKEIECAEWYRKFKELKNK